MISSQRRPNTPSSSRVTRFTQPAKLIQRFPFFDRKRDCQLLQRRRPANFYEVRNFGRDNEENPTQNSGWTTPIPSHCWMYVLTSLRDSRDTVRPRPLRAGNCSQPITSMTANDATPNTTRQPISALIAGLSEAEDGLCCRWSKKLQNND